MSETARLYAESLFALAFEKGACRDYFSSLEFLRDTLEKNPGYEELLDSPAIPKKERVKAACSSFEENVEEDVLSFFCLLCERGYVKELAACTYEYKRLLQTAENVSDATVTGAVEFSPAAREKMKLKLEALLGHPVNITYRVDPALIGGAVIEADGKVMDGSLRGKLRDVKEVIEK